MSKKFKSDSVAGIGKALFWFRSDLRLNDNIALSEAIQWSNNQGIVTFYSIIKENQENISKFQFDFLERNLVHLKNDLNKANISLIVDNFETNDSMIKSLVQLCLNLGIKAVFCNKELGTSLDNRDLQVSKALTEKEILFLSFEDQCIVTPGRVLTKEGKPYTMFTPFKNNWIKIVEQEKLNLKVKLFKASDQSIVITNDEKFTFPKSSFSCKDLWPGGEVFAQSRLKEFADKKIKDYKEKRDFPNIQGTSSLSPYLALGIISPRQCLEAALKGREINAVDLGSLTWINELCWRDFYRHILVAFPHINNGEPFKKEAKNIEWKNNEEHFNRWCNGTTGYPIVDAGMRQLKATGWMHNRVRMIVSMFLTKDLLIDWRKGEKYFKENLIDFDFPSNNGGWQWSSSTGTDSQPYFRIFNPVLQSEKFDPEGFYIKRWIPELQTLDRKTIHDPFNRLAFQEFEKLKYFKPIVNHSEQRTKTIETFKKAFSKEKTDQTEY